MNMNTNMQIMKKVNNGFKTKQDIVKGNFVSEDSSLVKIVSKGLGLIILESDEMTVEEINNVAKQKLGKYKMSEILIENICNSVMRIDDKELRILIIPENELLISTMK
ncbi:hypothetical protein [Vagococcus fluvialis]|uniref:hypothetical protein n=1 Tax=Vagococcus fluvialis TaxID=2738 RepID=UPI002033BF6C|nr:hypothetical protein [Vagococcus fluvialis]MCM2138836.1 hypothetical protein [Vagococcus fluvialis]